MMSKNRTFWSRNLTAKIASLILAVAVWFLVGILLEDPRRSDKDSGASSLLGPAVYPDLQIPELGEEEEPEKETPTVH